MGAVGHPSCHPGDRCARVAETLVERSPGSPPGLLVHGVALPLECGYAKVRIKTMHLKWFLFFVMFVLAAAQNPAIAEDSRPFLGGAGATPCEKWLSERKDKSSVLEFALEAWVLGFVSGANLVVDEQAGFLGGVAEDDILNRLDNHCHDHPADRLISAMLLITADLMKTRADLIRRGIK
jgi:hypothetical protein